MRRRARRTWSAALALLAGCQLWPTRPDYDDPLLLARKPRATTLTPSGPLLLAQAEPVVPCCEDVAYAANPPAPLPRVQVPSRLTADARGGSPSIVQPALRKKPTPRFAHAPDFSWVEGLLVRTPDGLAALRYQDSADGPGLLVLQDDPRLALYRAGDALHVEGEPQPFAGAASVPPTPYRIRLVRPALLAGDRQ